MLQSKWSKRYSDNFAVILIKLKLRSLKSLYENIILGIGIMNSYRKLTTNYLSLLKTQLYTTEPCNIKYNDKSNGKVKISVRGIMEELNVNETI